MRCEQSGEGVACQDNLLPLDPRGLSPPKGDFLPGKHPCKMALLTLFQGNLANVLEPLHFILKGRKDILSEKSVLEDGPSAIKMCLNVVGFCIFFRHMYMLLFWSPSFLFFDLVFVLFPVIFSNVVFVGLAPTAGG